MRSTIAFMLILAGVAAAPGLYASDSHATGSPVRVFIEHEVADYATWRKAYNSFESTQRKMGVTFQSVYQSVDNPNDVFVIHDFATTEKAKAFLASDELKNAMQKAGVKGPPHITITMRADK